MKAANRVIFNTSIVYIQLLLGIVIGLFSTRIVLNALGEEDYGIYVLVAGVIGLLNILGSNMANASMRFMSHSLGTGDNEKILKTFNTLLFIHFILGGIIILLLEIGGWFMFEYFLNIPLEKMFAAKIVFHCMVFSTFVAVISVPYDAVMNAHENLLMLSIVRIFGNVLNLAAALLLLYITSNLLIVYGACMMFNQILLRLIKQMYSKKKYKECKIRFKNYRDTQLTKSILSYTVWSFFGSLASMASNQIRDILINVFFGVKVNAATGISQTAGSKVNLVAVGLTQAINPQLMKSEGANNRQKMLKLTGISTKFATFLFALFAIPLIFEANYILQLWLKNVPAYAVIFFQLTLLLMLMDKFTFHIGDAIRAVGNIRNFQIMEAFTILLGLPISYIVFKKGGSPVSIYIVNLIMYGITALVRLHYGKKVAGLQIKEYFKKSILLVLIPLVIATVLAYIVFFNMDIGFIRLLIVPFLFIVSFTALFWMFGINKEEKNIIKNLIISIKLKIWKRH